MSRCNHDPISLTIQSTRLIVATVSDTGLTQVARNVPDLAPLRIEAHCLACGHVTVATSFNSPLSAWARWPRWLERRLNYLRRDIPELDEAMTAVGIPRGVALSA